MHLQHLADRWLSLWLFVLLFLAVGGWAFLTRDKPWRERPRLQRWALIVTAGMLLVEFIR